MFEKVSMAHPDKIADRIAGAIVDLAYTKQTDPKVAVEVLIGHGKCTIINETSCHITKKEIRSIVYRIGGKCKVYYNEVPQDIHLAENQSELRCGDNGIFKGVPTTREQMRLCRIAKNLYRASQTDGKYILDDNKLIICQSCLSKEYIETIYNGATINPLGDWTGGTNVDTGATNRKLGSDMADSVTGGGLHGKDLSKGDVSINIYAWLKAQILNKEIMLSCAIGDEYVDGRPYQEIVNIAREFINDLGGFEKLAEWGLIRIYKFNLDKYRGYYETTRHL